MNELTWAFKDLLITTVSNQTNISLPIINVNLIK